MDQYRLKQLRTMPYEEYLKTPEWAERREQVLVRDGHRCRVCDMSDNLQVHHRTYARRGNEDLNDLTTLCEGCHEHFHQRMSQIALMAKTGTLDNEERPPLNWEEGLIGMLLQRSSLIAHVIGILSIDDFTQEDTRALYQLLTSVPSVDHSYAQFVPLPLLSAANRMIDLVETRWKGNEIRAEFVVAATAQVKRKHLLQMNTELRTRIYEAEEAGEHEVTRQLQRQIVTIHQQLRVLMTPLDTRPEESLLTTEQIAIVCNRLGLQYKIEDTSTEDGEEHHPPLTWLSVWMPGFQPRTVGVLPRLQALSSSQLFKRLLAIRAEQTTKPEGA